MVQVLKTQKQKSAPFLLKYDSMVRIFKDDSSYSDTNLYLISLAQQDGLESSETTCK